MPYEGQCFPTLGRAWAVAAVRPAALAVALSGGVGAEVVAQGVEEDRAALMALYDATAGASWVNSTNWATAAPLDEWFGVVTDIEGRVAILELNGNGLSGPLPGSLGNLSNLVYLTLDDNGLSGPLPGSLGNLSKLEGLWLAQNGLSGPIPGHLGNLGNLIWLSLDNDTGLCLAPDFPLESEFARLAQELGLIDCAVAGDRAALVALHDSTGGPDWTHRSNWGTPAPLGDWYGVTTDAAGRVTGLDLVDNGLTGPIPPVSGGLARLESLSLGGNHLTGPVPAGLGNLGRLRVLDLHANELSGRIPGELGSLSNLEWLDLSANALTGPVPGELGNLGRLRVLDLHANELSGRIPGELGSLSNLEWLDLSANALTGPVPGELGNLGRLRALDLHANELSGRIPGELGSLSNLEGLDLSANALTGPVPWELGNLGRLRVLDLHANELSGRIPGELGSLSNLEWLDLSTNDLAGPVPARLGDLDQLQLLYLYDNELSGRIPEALGSLSNLEWLDLSANDLAGPVPARLGDLDQLQLVYLYDNELSGRIPRELGNLTDLRALDLALNDLSGRVPAELGNLSNLEWLSLSHNWVLSGPLPTRRQFPRLSVANIMATRACGSADWRDRVAPFEFAGTLCGAPRRNVTIDVTVVYTPAAREAAGGAAAIEASIDLGVAETNQALEASGVHHRLRLVDRFEVAYDETGDALLDFIRILRPSDGHLDELHALRDRVGADLVNVIVGESDKCEQASTDYGYSVARQDCDFAHTLGHSLGVRHDRYDAHDGGRGAGHPAYGYVNQPGLGAGAGRDRRWRTMMAGSAQCSDANVVCPRVLRFSNPRETWNGDPLGVPYGAGGPGVDGPADAAAVLEVTGPAVAQYRDRPPGANRPPVSAGALPDRRLTLPGSLDVDLSSAFVDPDGDALTYAVSSSAPDIVTVLAAGTRVGLTALAVGRAVIVVTAIDSEGLSATQTFEVRVTAPFTDDPLRPGVTPVRAVHFTELRAHIDSLRRTAGLTPFRWVDPELRAGVTPVRLAHLLDLRAALTEAYAAAGRAVPRWTDASPAAGSAPIRAAHVTELRAAVLALE